MSIRRFEDSEIASSAIFRANDILNRKPSVAVLVRLLEKAGLRDQRLHDLRRYHATVLLEEGVPFHVVAKRLGHRVASVTMNTHAHVTSHQEENASLIFAKAVQSEWCWQSVSILKELQQNASVE